MTGEKDFIIEFEPLRLLLEELVNTIEGKRKAGQTRKKTQCETKSDCQQDVQVRLMQLGYPTPEFKVESREVLLAIGWLLAVHSPLENVIKRLISSSVAGCEDSLCIRQENNDEDRVYGNLATVSHCHVKSQLQQLVWSIGHLKHSLLSLLSADHQRLSLLNKVHERTFGVNVTPIYNHLAAIDVMVICHSDVLDKYLEALERETKIIQTFLKWSKGYALFWKWMESVTDLKIQEGGNIRMMQMKEEKQHTATEKNNKTHTVPLLHQPVKEDTSYLGNSFRNMSLPLYGPRFALLRDQEKRPTDVDSVAEYSNKLKECLKQDKMKLAVCQEKSRITLQTYIQRRKDIICLPP
ncbi:uncharacterized protein LOC143226083 isoform X3 [Tachypleus tridentatus]|uniref:uncharacterized protein LOC143226083 isoform X3 n=1 Tax=Tachypleus tridentatus TaxID=6853 RepID=UPI003FD01625